MYLSARKDMQHLKQNPLVNKSIRIIEEQPSRQTAAVTGEMLEECPMYLSRTEKATVDSTSATRYEDDKGNKNTIRTK